MKITKWLALVISFLATLIGTITSTTFAQETKTFVAYSMKAAQSRVEAALKSGEDFRAKQPDLYYLGGITKPWAVVIDTASGDWILVGERDLKSSMLTLDDWVVGLRARFISAERDPGVTIDPQSCPDCQRAGRPEACPHMIPQKVRFFAGVENTHFGQVCYEADWLMKRIGLGIERVPVERLATYRDLLWEEEAADAAARLSVGSRFWFYPIVNRVNVFSDLVLLEKFQLGVFTELMYAEVDGEPVVNLEGFQYQPSEGFSRSFTDHFDEVAQVREVLETLRGLTRLAALARGLTQAETKPDLQFCLNAYPVQRIPTPSEAEVLRVEDRVKGFVIQGGVELSALAIRLKGGDAGALRTLVLETRPSPAALSWSFGVEIKDGQPVGVILPGGLADPGQVAAQFEQAQFLYAKKRYQDALEGLDAILRCCPEVSAEAWWLKAVVMREYGLATVVSVGVGADSAEGLIRESIALFQKCVETNPDFAAGYYELGATLDAFGESASAIEQYEKTIQLDPDYTTAYYSLGMLQKKLGRYDQAIQCLKRFLMDKDVNPLRDQASATIAQLEKKLRTAASSTAPGPAVRTYRNDKLRLSFDMPTTWTVLLRDELAEKTKGILTESSPNLVLAVANPENWDENVTLQVVSDGYGDEAPGSAELEQLVVAMDEEMPAISKDFMKVSHRVFKLNGAPALEYIMVSTRMNVWFQCKQIILFEPDRTLVLTCTATMETFGKIDECCFQTIIKSLRSP